MHGVMASQMIILSRLSQYNPLKVFQTIWLHFLFRKVFVHVTCIVPNKTAVPLSHTTEKTRVMSWFL